MEASALKLIMVQGPRGGETLDFGLGSKVRIGRVVRGNNLPIKDSGISSKHLSIESESGKWVLRDLDSCNGTVVNGAKIPPNAPLDLTDGDEIKIGECTSITVKIDGYEESRLRRNPRRSTAAAEATAPPVAETRGRRGRVAKESRENGEEIEVVGKRGRGRPPRARVLKSEVEEEKPAEENSVRQVSTRPTRSSRNEELGKILEEPRRTRVGGRRGKINVAEERVLGDKAAVVKERELGERLVIDVEEDEASKGLNNLEEGRDEEGGRRESSDKVENRGGGSVSGAKKSGGDKDGNGGGSVSGVKESSGYEDGNVDLDKMTMGEWFDFLEVSMPKQIFDETEKVIEEMREKARRVREYMAEQKEKGKAPVG